MSAELHPSFEQIMAIDAERDADSWGEVVDHYLMFGTESSDLMEIKSPGPIHLPTQGERISLHGVPVRVVSIETDYQLNGDYAPAVYIKVYIEPVESE